MSAATPRRRARELVLQGLYERQLSRGADDAIAASLTESPGYARADAAYFIELWHGVTSQYPALLETLAPVVDRKLEGLSPIERAVLVVGAWELSHRLDIPYRVVIDEAVEIAKSYGGTDGYKFVNGVLDKLAPRLRAAEMRAASKP
jgi:transcription antitermination protein NusB